MAYDVFISYSSKNIITANAICHVLEEHGIKCWIAPRDIAGGAEYGDIIPEAIKESKICVIIFSEYANMSRWVKNEVRIAFENNKIILPFKIDKTIPNGQMEVYLNGQHWIDAYPKADDCFDNLIQDVSLLLNNIDLEKSVLKKKKTFFLSTIIIIGIILIIALIVVSPLNLKVNNSDITDLNYKVDNNDTIDLNQSVNISYKLKSDEIGMSGQLFALVDGQEYKVELGIDQKCLSIIIQKDFDHDGLNDVLMENIRACGGNGVSNSYFFVAYKGTGFFSISKEFGDSWSEKPIVEKWNNQWSIVVESSNEGFNNNKPIVVKERYILKDGRAVMVESSKKNRLNALKEITAGGFSYEKPDEIKNLLYDLDRDGGIDTIVCSFWERWGSLNWEVHFSSGYSTISNLGCDRIGILKTITHGVNDIVCGEDLILKWDGKSYIEK